MHVLRIEHPVPSFDGWKKAFDRDPIGRKQIGVRRYRVFQPVDDLDFAAVDLEFDSAAEAESCRSALIRLWGRVEGSVMRDPRVRILAVVEDAAP